MLHTGPLSFNSVSTRQVFAAFVPSVCDSAAFVQQAFWPFSPPTALTVQPRHWEGSAGAGLQAPSCGQPRLALELLGALGEGRGAALPTEGGLLQDAEVGPTQHRRTSRGGCHLEFSRTNLILFSSVQGATVRRRYSKRSARQANAFSSPSSSSPNPSPERRRSGPMTPWRGSSSGGVLRCPARSPRRRDRYCSPIKGSSLVSGNVRKSWSSFSAALLQNHFKVEGFQKEKTVPVTNEARTCTISKGK